MSEQPDDERGTDDEPSTGGRLALDRRSALKGGVAGLTAVGLGALSTQPAAAHLPADKVGAAGATDILEIGKRDSDKVSDITTLVGPIDAKFYSEPPGGGHRP